MRASGGASSRTASCAGSVGGVIHLGTAAVVNDLGPVGQDRGQAAVEAARRPLARGSRRVRRLPLHHRRAGARRSARSAPRRASRAQLAKGDRRLGLPRLYDVRRLARRRRQGRDARPGSPGGGLPREDEGGWRPRLGRPPRRSDPARTRAERHPDDGREPGVGRRRGDRIDARSPRTNRGGSRSRRPRRRPRACPDPARHRARPGRDGEHIQNRVIFKQLFQAEAIDLPARRAGSAASTRRSRSFSWRPSSRSPCAPRRRCRTVRVRPAPRVLRLHRGQRLDGEPRRRVGRPPSRALPRPGRRSRRPLCRAGCAGQHRDTPESLDEYAFPNGPVWSDAAVAVGGE